jgi:hypothetical protein
MMSAVASARLDREFDKFLYASVGDDNNGMPLTVLTALARMDVDPWEEASKLMLLPQETAVAQLAVLLGSLGNSPVDRLDPVSSAARLIALLPRPRTLAPLIFKVFAKTAARTHPTAVSTVLTILTYVIFMVLSQWLLGDL